MIAYIPLAIGQVIYNPSLVSLAQQSIALDILACCAPGVLKVNGAYKSNIEKVAGEVRSRNLAIELMLNSTDEFAIMQDNDILHVRNDNYAMAIEHMQQNKDVAAAVLPWQSFGRSSHIKISAMVLRVKAMQAIRFRDDGRHHTCLTFTEDVIAAGYRCEYLPIREILVKELGKPDRR